MTIGKKICAALASIVLTAGCGGIDDPRYGASDDAIKVCAAGDVIEGIDVSYWQGPSVDWAAVAASGKQFAFIRVNHGVATIDEYFDRNWKGARDYGIVRGAYQFFVPSDDVAQQARILIDKLAPILPGDLPPVLDVEEADPAGAASLAAKVKEWMDLVEPALKVKPFIYTGKYFWETNVSSGAFTSNPLWVANWGVTCPDIPADWPSWKFWQYSSTGAVAGISGNVDLDVFNGTLNDLKKLAVQVPNPVCGDGVCNGDETGATCAKDCAPFAFVKPGDGETVANPVTFRVDADPAVAKVNYFAESWPIGSSTDAQAQFEVAWTFSTLGVRKISAEGLDKFGTRVAAASIEITIVAELPDGGTDAGADAEADARTGGEIDAETPPDAGGTSDAGDITDAGIGPDAAMQADTGIPNPCGAGTMLDGETCVLDDAGTATPGAGAAETGGSGGGCGCTTIAID